MGRVGDVFVGDGGRAWKLRTVVNTWCKDSRRGASHNMSTRKDKLSLSRRSGVSQTSKVARVCTFRVNAFPESRPN